MTGASDAAIGDRFAVIAARADGGRLALAAVACGEDAAPGEDRICVELDDAGRLADALDEVERFAAGRTRVAFDVAAMRVEVEPFASRADIDILRRSLLRTADVGLFAMLVHPEWEDPTLPALATRLELDSAADDPAALRDATIAALLLLRVRHDLSSESDERVRALRDRLDDAHRPESVLVPDAVLECEPIASDDPPPARAEVVEPRPRLDDGELLRLFETDGPLARRVDRYVRREAQVALARTVAAAINDGRSGLVEAGTGVGKSFGYLVPLVLHASRSQRPVVVSTHTKSLQSQLLDKDLAPVLDATGAALRVTMVKGRRDYLCRSRLRSRLAAAFERGDADEQLAAIYFERFEERVDDGDLERIAPWLLRAAPAVRRMRRELRCEHDASGDGCSFGERCFYPRVARRASESHLLIANHALTLRWPRAFPTPDVVVFDEAHALVDAATDAFTRRFSERDLRVVLSDVVGGGMVRAMRRAERRSGPLPRRIRDQVEDAIDEIGRVVARLNEVAERAEVVIVSCGGRAAPGRSEVMLRLDERVRATDGYASFAAAAAELGATGRRAVGILARVRSELLRDAADAPDRAGELIAELGAVAVVLEEALEALDLVANGGERSVCWLARSRVGGETAVTARAAPLSVAEPFATRVLSGARVHVLTSATLRLDGGFELFERELGLDLIEPSRRLPSQALGSPLDYRGSLRFFVPLGGPDPLDRDDHAAARAIARALLLAATAAHGRTLGLFNSRARLFAAERLMRGPLSRVGLRLLCAGRDGTPAQVLARYRDEERAVLIGSRALFQGIDLAGERLVCVVIDRIPFEAPDEPVHQARVERLEQDGRSGFYGYSLPRAMLRLLQGAGRLIRSEKDRGAVVLLDPRVATRRGYGGRIRAALPAECCIGPEERVFAELVAELSDSAGSGDPPARLLDLLAWVDGELGSGQAGVPDTRST